MDPARRDARPRLCIAPPVGSAEPGEAAKTSVERIESGLNELEPSLKTGLDDADGALARSASFIELADLQPQPTNSAAH
jgi:hypothetical protein